jgi:hypothetical protein
MSVAVCRESLALATALRAEHRRQQTPSEKKHHIMVINFAVNALEVDGD